MNIQCQHTQYDLDWSKNTSLCMHKYKNPCTYMVHTSTHTRVLPHACIKWSRYISCRLMMWDWSLSLCLLNRIINNKIYLLPLQSWFNYLQLFSLLSSSSICPSTVDPFPIEGRSCFVFFFVMTGSSTSGGSLWLLLNQIWKGRGREGRDEEWRAGGNQVKVGSKVVYLQLLIVCISPF